MVEIVVVALLWLSSGTGQDSRTKEESNTLEKLLKIVLKKALI
jgi:hypothetical protein